MRFGPASADDIRACAARPDVLEALKAQFPKIDSSPAGIALWIAGHMGWGLSRGYFSVDGVRIFPRVSLR